MMSVQTIIKNCQLFSGLDESAARALGEAAAKQSHAQKSIIFSEGDAVASFFILIDGSVDLIKSTPDGREQLVRQVKPGEMFAEAAMFSGIAYPATAIARTDSTLVVITKPSFVSIVKEHPEVALAIMGTMAKLLRHLNKLVSDLSLGSVASRLARYLIDESKKIGAATFDLPIAKRDLAFKLGTVPETLSRTFKKFASKGVVEVHGRTININDIGKLKKLV